MLKRAFVVVFILFYLFLDAQSGMIKDSINIPDITIFGKKQQKMVIDNKLNDSLFFVNNLDYSLTGVLLNNTSLYTKTYGPGLITSYGIRGSNSAQTKVMWNGFSINNSMLGNADVSLLNIAGSSVKIDKSSLYPEGLGGAIILNDKISKNTNNLTSDISYNTLQNFSFNGIIGFSNKYLKNSLVFSSEYNDNIYSFRRGMEKYKISNSGAKKLLIKYNGVHKKNNSTIKLFALANKYFRNIPPAKYETFSDASQLDEGLKTGLHYNLLQNAFALKAKAGYFIDRLKYRFPYKNIFSDSRIYKFQYGVKLDWNLYKSWLISLNIDDETAIVKTDIYGKKKEHKLYYSGTVYANITKSILLKTGIRSVYYIEKLMPLYPFIQINYRYKVFKFNFNIGENYRLPGLNDRYWPDVGIEDLKPEKSFFTDFNADFNLGNNFKIIYSLYYKSVRDMIQWLPQQGVWRPKNIERVYSKGLDLGFTAKGKVERLKIEAILSYGYNKSTTSINSYNNIIYNPNHILLFVSRFEYKKWYLSITSRYNSKVFVSYDNIESIPSWFVFDFKISNDFKIKKSVIKYIIEINNLFDADYEAIKNYPMPGRYFSFGLKYIINY